MTVFGCVCGGLFELAFLLGSGIFAVAFSTLNILRSKRSS